MGSTPTLQPCGSLTGLTLQVGARCENRKLGWGGRSVASDAFVFCNGGVTAVDQFSVLDTSLSEVTVLWNSGCSPASLLADQFAQ